MPDFKPPLTFEELHHTVAALELYGTAPAASQALGWTKSKFEHRIRCAREVGMVPPVDDNRMRPGRKPHIDFGYKRHLFIPDMQVKPGIPIDHIDWIAQAIVDYEPDVIVVGGDWWDFPSLNSHVEPGSAELEGGRFNEDVVAGNVAFAKLCQPMEKEIAKRGNSWHPRKVFICGNHEDRADRAAMADPKWLGTIGSNHCNVRDFEWNGFLKRVWIDGICYSHFFQNQHSKHAIGGTVDNRLNKIGASFVQGHEQGFRYGNRITGSGHTWHGLVAGSAYVHVEHYRGAQGQRHWRGVVIMNEVNGGEYDIMPLSLGYLCRKYERQHLHAYFSTKYPAQDWSHLE